MAGQARGQFLVLAMEWSSARTEVACRTFWHDLVIILLTRAVSVVHGMTSHTINLVFCPLCLDSLKVRKVTLSALGRCQRLYLHIIRGYPPGFFCSSRIPFSWGRPWLSYTSVHCDESNNTHDTNDYSHFLRNHHLITSELTFIPLNSLIPEPMNVFMSFTISNHVPYCGNHRMSEIS